MSGGTELAVTQEHIWYNSLSGKDQHGLLADAQGPRASDRHLELPQGNKPTIPTSLKNSSDLCQGRLYVQVIKMQLHNSAVHGLNSFCSYLQKNGFISELFSQRQIVFHQLLLSLFFFQFQLFLAQKLNSQSSCIYLTVIPNERNSLLVIPVQEMDVGTLPRSSSQLLPLTHAFFLHFARIRFSDFSMNLALDAAAKSVWADSAHARSPFKINKAGCENMSTSMQTNMKGGDLPYFHI